MHSLLTGLSRFQKTPNWRRISHEEVKDRRTLILLKAVPNAPEPQWNGMKKQRRWTQSGYN